MPAKLKSPDLRQRRNKTSTKADLVTAETPRRRAPSLPKRGDGEKNWHPTTRSWWRELWRSPQAEQFLRVDVGGLFVLARLIDSFWDNPTPSLGAEIRQQSRAFGLDPISRVRLQWSVKRGAPATPREVAPKAEAAAEDPRAVLRMVK